MSSSSSSDGDENFLRLHAKAIAEALQQQETAEQALAAAGGGATTKSQRDQLLHDTYIALCHDDPRVESEFACQCLATALLDPQSPYALSGPLVEGIRQLCSRDEGEQKAPPTPITADDKESLTNANAISASPPNSNNGSAILAWAIYARIPFLCCQASNLSEIRSYLGSYRPPPPPIDANNADANDQDLLKQKIIAQQKNEQADQLAALLSQPLPPEEEPDDDENINTGGQDDDDDDNEVWAADSDPSDFEFDSGFSYDQQINDLQDSFAEWMMDRSDPLKLSGGDDKAISMNWKQVRHAVMELTSQLTYRKVQSLWTMATANTTTGTGNSAQALSGTSQEHTDLLTQFTMTLLIPPPTMSASSPTKNSRPSIFDSPDDEEDVLQPQRQLQAMAWYPLWVVRDAAINVNSQNQSAQYLSLLQTLIAVDAANTSSSSATTSTANTASASMAPATYVGLASLSALCQQFVTADSNHSSTSSSTSTTNNDTVEQFRSLRQSIWEMSDDLTHALEQEDKFRKAALKKASETTEGNDNGTTSASSDWIVWTMLPMFEILSNQRLLTGTTIMAKAESTAQRHYQQQTSQRWSGLLQSGLFKQWLLRLQGLRDGSPNSSNSSSSPPVLWQLVRRSLLYMIAQSTPATSALGKYAWRFPKFVSAVEIGPSFQNQSKVASEDKEGKTESSLRNDVDDTLWNLLSVELAGAGVSAAAPTIQWKSSAKKPAALPLPTRVECQKVSWEGFQTLCQQVVRVLEVAAQEENKKENTVSSAAEKEKYSSRTKASQVEEQQLVLRSFHRLVYTIVACPLLAKLFVHDLELNNAVASDGEDEAATMSSSTISKCLDAIQEALSQYKAPPPRDTAAAKLSQTKVKDEDAIAQPEEEPIDDEIEPTRAKEQSQSMSLNEDIHMVRKVLKVARSLLATTPATVSSQNLTSSSKTD